MNNTLTIARREFRSYFNSPAAYIVGEPAPNVTINARNTSM